jgi:hypothetical protein
MSVKNQHLTAHTISKVKALGLFLSERAVFTRLDIMALNMACSSRQIRRYLVILEEYFDFQFIQKPQGFKMLATRLEVESRLKLVNVDFRLHHIPTFNPIMLNQR